MKILLWGVCSPWTINFVENFLLKNDCEVWILFRGNKREYKDYIEFYKEKRVHLIELPSLVSEIRDGKGRGDFFKTIYARYLQLKVIVNAGPFDLINMQFIYYPDLFDVIILKYLMRTKLILSYWGSDLLRVKESELISKGRYVRHTDFITFDSADLETEFKRVYKWASKMPSKVVLLGLPVLNIINENLENRSVDDIRRKWGISRNKTVIAIGYNGIPEQQHKKVLNAISKLDGRYKEKIVLILQMSYGGSRGYRKSVIEAVRRTGFEYVDIQSFLSNDEVAELRIITDIFINAQITDAFSGSVCEYLFAGAILINAKWLCYKEFKKYNFQYLEFENFDEVHLLIEQAMEQRMDVSKNRELVWKLRSWEHCAAKWQKVYKRMC